STAAVHVRGRWLVGEEGRRNYRMAREARGASGELCMSAQRLRTRGIGWRANVEHEFGNSGEAWLWRFLCSFSVQMRRSGEMKGRQCCRERGRALRVRGCCCSVEGLAGEWRREGGEQA